MAFGTKSLNLRMSVVGARTGKKMASRKTGENLPLYRKLRGIVTTTAATVV